MSKNGQGREGESTINPDALPFWIGRHGAVIGASVGLHSTLDGTLATFVIDVSSVGMVICKFPDTF
jgi:hypothetical protein